MVSILKNKAAIFGRGCVFFVSGWLITVKKRWKNFAESVKKCTFASETGISKMRVLFDLPKIENYGQLPEIVGR